MGGRNWLPEMMRPTRWGGRFCLAAVAAMLGFWTVPHAQAQSSTPAPHVGSRGENFSNKPAPALFATDCTGAGCHKGPQGLGKGQSQSGLAGFLREHYTNSRESAGSLAAYILKLPASAAAPAPDPRAARASTPPRSGPPSWFDPEPAETRPPGEIRGRERQPPPEQGGRPARSAARPADAKPADAKPADAKPAETRSGDEPEPSAATPAEPAAPSTPADRRRRTAEPAEPAKPAPTPRNQRGRQQPTTAAAPAPAEPAPPPAPAAPPPPQFDIFD